MFKTKKKLALFCALTVLGAACSAPAFAAASDSAQNGLQNFVLDELVVTANRTEQKVIDANANISVITRADIERMHYDTVEDALKSVPGVQFQSYSGGFQNANMNSIRINGSQRVLILVDGIRLNPAGASQYVVNLRLLNNMDNIERIEVLKGSAGTLYGSDAVGGVINIITKNIDSNKTSYKTSAGSFGKITHSLYNQGVVEDEKSGNKFSYNVYYNEDRSSNYKDGNGVEHYNNFDGHNGGVKLRDEIGKHTFTLQYDQSESDYSSINEESWIDATVPYQYGHTKNKTLMFIHDFKIDDTLSNKFVVRDTENIWNFIEANDWGWGSINKGANDLNYKTLTVSDQLSKKFNEWNSVIVGYEHNKTDFGKARLAGYYDDVSDIYTENIDWDNGGSEVNSYYLQHDWKFTDKWQLTSGLRYDTGNLETIYSYWDEDYNQIFAKNKEDFDNNLSKSFNLSYKFDDKHNIYFDYHDYFVIPTPDQVANPTYGNPMLEAAKGKNYSIGYNQIFDDTTQMSLHAFLRDGDDISLGRDQYNNMRDVKDMGFDVQLNKQIANNWNTYIGYTYIHHKSDYSADTDRVKLGYLPKHTLNLGISYTDAKFDAGINARASIGRDGENRTRDDGKKFWENENYLVVDLAANYQATKNIKLFAAVNNLFDEYYAESAMQNVDPEQRFTSYAMPGRNFVAGVEVSF